MGRAGFTNHLVAETRGWATTLEADAGSRQDQFKPELWIHLDVETQWNNVFRCNGIPGGEDEGGKRDDEATCGGLFAGNGWVRR